MRGIALLGGLVLASVLVPVSTAPAGAAPAPLVAVVDLGALPGATDSEAVDINDEGVVVGRSGGHAVRWDQSGRITDLGTLPGGYFSHAVAINERGTVVGQSVGADYHYHLVLWNRNGRITDIGMLPGGTWFDPIDITDDGTVLGRGNDAEGRERAALWHRDTGFVMLDGPGGTDGVYAAAINRHGDVVGNSFHRDTFGHALRWTRDGTVTDLGAFGDMSAYPADINDAGVAVGTVWLGLTPNMSPVWWNRSGRTIAVPTPHGRGWGQAINRLGVMVGTSGDRGLRWDRDNAPTVLADVPALPVSRPTDLNDHGTVIGQASGNQDGEWTVHAARWTPDGAVTDLGTLGGRDSWVTALNGQGTTVGTADTADGHTRAVLWPAPLGG